MPTSTASLQTEYTVGWIKYVLIIHKNNTAEIINCADYTKRYTYPLGTYKLEPFPTRNGYLMVNYICANKNTITTQYNIIQHNMIATTTTNFSNYENLADIAATRNNLPYISFGTTWVHLLVTSNEGNSRFYFNRTTPLNPEILFDFTQEIKPYLYNYVSEFKMYYHLYFKKYDTFYCINALVNSSNISVENEYHEIGDYQDLFEGLNGDLFVVMDNQLFYIQHTN